MRISRILILGILLMMFCMSKTGVAQEEKINELINQLKIGKWEAKSKAILELRKIGKPAVEALITTLKSEDVILQREAAHALGDIGDIRAIKPLINTLEDEDEKVRNYVDRALTSITGQHLGQDSGKWRKWYSDFTQLVNTKETIQGDTVVANILGKQITRKELQPSTELMEQNRAQMNELKFMQWISRYQKDKLGSMIWEPLIDEYVRENDIEPTDEEIEALIVKLEGQQVKMQLEWEQKRNELAEKLKPSDLTEAERDKVSSQLQTFERLVESGKKRKQYAKENEEKMRESQKKVASSVILSWKINKSLYDKYGGRVIFQQAGSEPVDAYRDFLKEHEKKGSFKIMDEVLNEQFWDYFVSDRHTFYSAEEGAKFMNTPWWLLEKDKN